MSDNASSAATVDPPDRPDRQRNEAVERDGDEQEARSDGAATAGPTDVAADEPDAPAKEKKPPLYKRPIVIIVAIAVVVIAAVILIPWYLESRHYESTDDAFVDVHSERVAPRVAGRVLRVNVEDNEDVEAGEVLVEIDPADVRAQRDQTQAALSQAKSQVAEAEAQHAVAEANAAQSEADVEVAQATYENAEADLRRYQSLSREAVSQQVLDNAEASARTAKAQLVAAQKRTAAAEAQVKAAEAQGQTANAAVRAAEARVEMSQLQLDYTTIRAENAGRVTRRGVTAGDYVSVGQQLLVVVPDDVYVTANFKETQLADMRPGQPVDIAVDAYPDQDFHGKVQSIQSGTGSQYSLLPPENATGNYVKVVQRVPVKIVFDETDDQAHRRLSPGMSVVPSVKVR